MTNAQNNVTTHYTEVVLVVERPSQTEDNTVENSPQPLFCVEKLLSELNKKRHLFDASKFDLLRMVIKGLNTWDQKVSLTKPMRNQEGLYIRNVTELRDKLQQPQFQRCNNDTLPKIALCTVQHSNGPYMQEFIAHYLLLGVSRFIIYDNSKPGSPESDYFRNVVQPFVEAGIVEVKDWYFEPGNRYRQIPALEECIKNNDQFDWIALYDSDEFLIIHEPHPPCLNQLMTNFTSYGGLSVFWRLMSPLGVGPHRDPSRLLIDQSEYQIANVSGTVKVILQPKYFGKMQDAHTAYYTQSQHAVDFHGNKILTTNLPFYETPTWADVELRHFYGRDWSYYLYDKICSRIEFSKTHFYTNRIRRLLTAFAILDTKVETNTQHNDLLRQFLSLPGLNSTLH